MTARLAVDMANYSDVPTRDQVECLKRQGVVRAIIGCSYGLVARQQLQAIVDAGVEVQAYAWEHWDDEPWQPPVDKCLAMIFGLPVSVVYLDCEEWAGTADADVQRCVDAAAYIFDHAPQVKEVRIYSGQQVWVTRTNNSDALSKAGWKLWFAAPVLGADGQLAGANPPPDPSRMIALPGGWTAPVMWQYTGSTSLCDLNVDVSLILEEEEIVDAPTKPEFAALFQFVMDTSNSMRAIATAFAAHVQAGAPAGNDQAVLAALQTELDQVEKRQAAAAAALAGP